MSKTILVVDDNQELRAALYDYLSGAGFSVLTAAHGEEMRSLLCRHRVHLIILDIMLPGEDGFTLCRQIRQHANTPIIMLTAVTDEADKVTGLELGADDYITKSFSPRELLARIKAVIRRSQLSAPSHTSRYIMFSGFTLDTITRRLEREGYPTRMLSGADMTLLNLFLRTPNSILTRDQIAREIWGRDAEPLERGIDVQISRLRQHLQDKERNLIIAVRNKGYLLNTEDIHAA